jgi:hypothetical protein
MMNDILLKAEILKKEIEMEKLENNYLKSQNEELLYENKQLAFEVKELSEKIVNFQDLMENLPRGPVTEFSIRDYLLYLQNQLSDYKKKYADAMMEAKQARDVLDEEKDKVAK